MFPEDYLMLLRVFIVEEVLVHVRVHRVVREWLAINVGVSESIITTLW